MKDLIGPKCLSFYTKEFTIITWAIHYRISISIVLCYYNWETQLKMKVRQSKNLGYSIIFLNSKVHEFFAWGLQLNRKRLPCSSFWLVCPSFLRKKMYIKNRFLVWFFIGLWDILFLDQYSGTCFCSTLFSNIPIMEGSPSEGHCSLLFSLLWASFLNLTTFLC